MAERIGRVFLGDVGANSVVETFTEAIAVYKGNPQWLQERHPQAYEYIKNNVVEGLSVQQGFTPIGGEPTQQEFTPIEGKRPDPSNRVVTQTAKPKRTIRERWEEFRIDWFNKNQAIYNTDKDVGMLAENSANANGTVIYILGTDGKGELVDSNGKSAGVSLSDIFEDMNTNISPEKSDAFLQYLAQSDNIARAKEGKNVIANYDSNMSEQYVKQEESANPEFVDMRKKLIDWIDAFNQKWAVETGLIDADIYKQWRAENPYYLPENRVFDEIEKAGAGGTPGRGFVDTGSPVKRATGFRQGYSFI